MARQLHELSPRRAGPFVAVNCAALVETLVEAELFGIEERTATGVRGRRGKFEQADGGTLMLDEIAEMPSPIQAKLLHVLQDRAVTRLGSNRVVPIDVRSDGIDIAPALRGPTCSPFAGSAAMPCGVASSSPPTSQTASGTTISPILTGTSFTCALT